MAGAVAGTLDGGTKPENSHSCNGNTLCAVSWFSLGRFLFVGMSLILIVVSFSSLIDFTF